MLSWEIASADSKNLTIDIVYAGSYEVRPNTKWLRIKLGLGSLAKF